VQHTLKTIILFDGHPSTQRSLKYDEIVEHKTETVHVWRLDPETEYWLQCGYSGTKVVLARRAPRGAKRCEVAWSSHYREVKWARCR
jgi:hypothetical protein